MDRFNGQDFHELLADRPSPCVSVLMPTTRGPGFADARRLKNLLRTAREQCEELEARYPNAAALLKPLQRLVEDEGYWKDASSGFAAFAASGMTRTYRLPLALPEMVVVAPRFHLKPLASFLTGDRGFYVLALSQKHVRLLHGHRQSVDALTLPANAVSFAAAMRYDDIELSRTVHSHPASGGPAKAQEAIAHGHGIGVDSAKDGIHDFCLHIRREVDSRLHDAREPLMLAGTEPLLSAYRAVNRYHNLATVTLVGNPDLCSDAHLAARARSLLQVEEESRGDEAAALYRQLAGTGRTMNDTAGIMAASFHGDIQHLFFRSDVDAWACTRATSAEPEIHPERNVGDEDMINYAMLHVLAHGGEIHPCRPDEAPDDKPLSAILWLPLGERRRRRIA